MDMLLVGVLLISTAAILLLTSRSKRWPPSPGRKFPIIGHLLLLGKSPHQSLSKLAKQYGGLMYLKLGAVDTIVASTCEAAEQVLKTYDHIFASRPQVTAALGYKQESLVWAPYGSYWRKVRKICTLEMLTVKRVQQFKPLRSREMSIFVRELICSSGKTVSMSSKLSDLTFNTMTRIVVNKSYSEGTDESKQQSINFKNTIARVFEVARANNIADLIPWFKWMGRHNVQVMRELHREQDEYMQMQLDEHKRYWNKNEMKDFMDVMLSLEDLSDIGKKSLAKTMIAAGTDTSSVAVEWALAELVNHPQTMKNLQQELENVIGLERTLQEEDIPQLKYLEAVIKETLRLHPPAPLLVPHESNEACKIGKYFIPAKTRLIVNAYAIGRDEKMWIEPEKFAPERFLHGNTMVDIKGQNFTVIPFGAGRRMCPGVTLGMTMVSYILGSLVHAFEWSMPGGLQELDMKESIGLTLHRSCPLELIPLPRLPTYAYEYAYE